ncbi:sulfur carrier protein ThiS [Shewanella sp. JNE10-2]|uniref:sulfur carrier protein ThiS n=1 Tax=unclassified Shewanella TaxID=196818 RepID=UPI002003FD62|nr:MULTISPECIES: sulfur carrier protein ThiS [unclassified Shewanella]MCK7631078.1 sulfur carrier protein ThiS [Shewanella sp. JNE9-1]MCK7646331.1 sulfur carrier protein ThiS [Shewanella sp. JNE3-1]MCK7654286.1 sulfur carrier protein ThiS [Shewanella sp. JNE4-1]UPO26204.1 sulfur carrier protein ThiS [Shewanella sp. JNE10-2]UPO37190.1 sulfur carrier protein ThiS [Shewanella sp. JNE7]
MILIHINNIPQLLSEPTSLEAVILAQNIALDSVAIVLNAEVVPRNRWQSILCQHEDKLELFSAVAGG